MSVERGRRAQRGGEELGKKRKRERMKEGKKQKTEEGDNK